MNRILKRILGAATAAAVAVGSLGAVPAGVLPDFSIAASAETETLGGAYTFTKLAENTYAIRSKTELKNLAYYVNAGNDCTGLTFKQTADIDMQGETYTPIGNDDENLPFKGAYDGDGYVIKNISHYDSGLYSLSGLFGLLKGSVKNVNLKDCSFGGRNAGGIAGEMDDDDGTVQNCTVLGGTITCTDGSGAGHFGGIVGYFYGGAVDGCFTTTTFSGNGSTMGPVVGMDEDVTNCYYVNTPGGNSRGTEVTVYDITLGDG
ncbi:MAG: hypothetical protein IJT87_11680, partial [Ruminiclostridium sp.]|nr:hypothetical protein [Ruminiclostridium sp.]